MHSKWKHPAASYNHSIFLHVHHSLCEFSSAPPLESRQISSGKGDKSYHPLTLSSATATSTALLSDQASILTRSVRKLPVNLAHKYTQGSRARKQYWSSNLTGHSIGRSRVPDESYNVLSEKLDTPQQGKKNKTNTFQGSTLPWTINSWCFNAWSVVHTLNANVEMFCILIKTGCVPGAYWDHIQ